MKVEITITPEMLQLIAEYGLNRSERAWQEQGEALSQADKYYSCL